MDDGSVRESGGFGRFPDDPVAKVPGEPVEENGTNSPVDEPVEENDTNPPVLAQERPPTDQTPKSERVPRYVANEVMRDVLLWRRKKMSSMVLCSATLVWVLMEIYELKALTLVCWFSMLVITGLFVWNATAPLCGKESFWVPEFQISEESATRGAQCFCRTVDDGLRWVRRVVAEERDVVVFGEMVAALWLLSVVGGCFDFITFAYLCTVVGFSFPVLYFKYEKSINGLLERGKKGVKRGVDSMKQRGERMYKILDERFLARMKKKPVKDKKAE